MTSREENQKLMVLLKNDGFICETLKRKNGVESVFAYKNNDIIIASSYKDITPSSYSITAIALEGDAIELKNKLQEYDNTYHIRKNESFAELLFYMSNIEKKFNVQRNNQLHIWNNDHSFYEIEQNLKIYMDRLIRNLIQELSNEMPEFANLSKNEQIEIAQKAITSLVEEKYIIVNDFSYKTRDNLSINNINKKDRIISLNDAKKEFPFYAEVLEEAVKYGQVTMRTADDIMDIAVQEKGHNGCTGFRFMMDGCGLDIASHKSSVGGIKYFDVALLDKNENMIAPKNTSFEFSEVIGYQSANEVIEIIKEYSKYNAKENKFLEENKKEYNIQLTDDSTENRKIEPISLYEAKKTYPFFAEILEVASQHGDIMLFIEKGNSRPDHNNCTGLIIDMDGCKLDLISNEKSYGNFDCVEIHLLDKNNNHIYPENTDFEIDVLGFRSPEETVEIINKYSKYDAKENKFIEDIEKEIEDINSIEDL